MWESIKIIIWQVTDSVILKTAGAHTNLGLDVISDLCGRKIAVSRITFSHSTKTLIQNLIRMRVDLKPYRDQGMCALAVLRITLSASYHMIPWWILTFNKNSDTKLDPYESNKNLTAFTQICIIKYFFSLSKNERQNWFSYFIRCFFFFFLLLHFHLHSFI